MNQSSESEPELISKDNNEIVIQDDEKPTQKLVPFDEVEEKPTKRQKPVMDTSITHVPSEMKRPQHFIRKKIYG